MGEEFAVECLSMLLGLGPHPKSSILLGNAKAMILFSPHFTHSFQAWIPVVPGLQVHFLYNTFTRICFDMNKRVQKQSPKQAVTTREGKPDDTFSGAAHARGALLKCKGGLQWSEVR